MATHRMGPIGILLGVLLVVGAAGSAIALPELYEELCASCHQDDSPTCAGCHNHRGELRAAPDRDSYAPGDTVRVTLSGGVKPGWIRGLLYDHEGGEIARASGPTGSGDDGIPADSVSFPVVMSALAPVDPGEYTWRAAYYGIFHITERTHDEEWTPVTFLVAEADSLATGESWGRIKSLFHLGASRRPR